MPVNRQDNIYTYALIKALFDHGVDYIDSFWPLVIKVFNGKESLNLKTIQKRLEDVFSLKTPTYTLRTILKRAKREGYVNEKDNNYALTNKGEEYLDKFETDKEVGRRVRSLLRDLNQFLEEKNIFLGIEKLEDILMDFLKKNIENVIEFFDPTKAEISEVPTKFNKPLEDALMDYIETAERERPDYYKTLQDLVYGSIISTTLELGDPNKIREQFKNLIIYLDMCSPEIFDLINPTQLHSPTPHRIALKQHQL